MGLKLRSEPGPYAHLSDPAQLSMPGTAEFNIRDQRLYLFFKDKVKCFVWKDFHTLYLIII